MHPERQGFMLASRIQINGFIAVGSDKLHGPDIEVSVEFVDHLSRIQELGQSAEDFRNRCKQLEEHIINLKTTIESVKVKLLSGEIQKNKLNLGALGAADVDAALRCLNLRERTND